MCYLCYLIPFDLLSRRYLRLDPLVASPAAINALVYGLDRIAALTAAGKTPAEAEAALLDEQPFRKTVAAAVASLGSVEELTALRAKTYDEKLRSGVERANKDFEADAVPDCARADCESPKETGDYYCLDCKKHFCDDCAYGSWPGHSRAEHRVMCNMDLEDEDLE